MGDPEGAANTIWHSQFLVFQENRVQFVADAGWKRSTAPVIEADVHTQTFVACYKSFIVAVDHGVEVVNAFVIHVQELCGYRQGFTVEYFTDIVDVHTQGKYGMLFSLGVIEAKPPGLVDSISHKVKCQDVISHVHVAVMVDPFGQHGECCSR